MGWDRFEQLLLAVTCSALGIRGTRVRRYGIPGQAQHGIDLAGREPDRRYAVIQCKDYTTFTVADLKAAVETFANGRRPFGAYKFIVATSASTALTQLADELASLQDTYTDLELDLWGSEQINDHLRYMADVVARFWSRETAENFCTGVRRQGVPAPPPDRQTQAERVLLGPLNTPDTSPVLREAEVVRAEEPSRAAELYGILADRLFEENFRGHALILRRKQLEALADAQEHGQAITLAGELTVAALNSGDRRAAIELAHLAEEVHRRAVESASDAPACEREVELLSAAANAAQQPAGLSEQLWESLASPNGYEPAYQPSLVLLLAENVFALAPERLPELDSMVEAAIHRSDDSGTNPAIKLRLRLVRAEYDVEQRTQLLRLARTRQLPGILAALVSAREARRCGLEGMVDEAIEAWRNAVNDAIHAGYDGDASDWLYALREVSVRYGPWTENLDDEHRLAQALSATGSGRRLLDRVRPPREAAMVALVGNSPIEAAVWGRRWLVDAVVAGSWADESDAAGFLGDLYRNNQEPALSARFYQRAGREKDATELAQAVGDLLLPFDALTDAPWWVLNVRVTQVAKQADLLDDDTAAGVLDQLMGLVIRGRAGELIDSPSNSLALSAAQAACNLAERGTASQAETLLATLAADVPREPNHFCRTDDEHAEACVRIADRHPSLALLALNRLLDLAQQNAQRAQKILVRNNVQVHFGAQPSGVRARSSTLSKGEQATLRDRVAELARERRFLAAAVLRSVAPDHPLVHERATEARTRILTRAEPDPSRIEFFTSLTMDAYLASALPATQVYDCLKKVLTIAEDSRETASSRHEALAGATSFVLRQDVRTKQATFILSQEFVSGTQDGSHLDNDVTGEPHPLSDFTINFGTSSLRGYGLKLAEAAATSELEEAWVRDQAVALLMSSDRDDVGTAATVLASLSDEIASPLDLALLASHQNINVRQVCAFLCSRWPERYRDLMLALATDPEYRVRSVLANAIAHLPESDQARLTDVCDVLAGDRRHCVRAALSS